MSRTIILVLTSLIVSSFGTLKAQMELKPAIGCNFTDFSKNPSTGKFQAEFGWQIGGSIAFGQKIYFEPGIYYMEKSTQYSQEGSSPLDIKYNLNGIRIPVAVGIKILGDKESLVQLRAFGGLSGFFVTGTSNLQKDSLNTASFGLFAGAGLDISHFFVDLSYEWSLTNISSDVSQVDVGKTRSLFIQVGFRLHL